MESAKSPLFKAVRAVPTSCQAGEEVASFITLTDRIVSPLISHVDGRSLRVTILGDGLRR